jgi:hypothetical protein
LKVIDYPKVANSAQELLYSFQNEIHLQKNLRSLSHLTFFLKKKKRVEKEKEIYVLQVFPMPMSFAQPNYFSHILSLCYLHVDSFSKALAKCVVRNYRRILKLWFYGKLSSKTKIFDSIFYRSDSSFEMVFHSTLITPCLHYPTSPLFGLNFEFYFED